MTIGDIDLVEINEAFSSVVLAWARELLIDELTTGLDAGTGTHVLTVIRRRLPHAVLVLATHELPADASVLGRSWSAVPLD